MKRLFTFLAIIGVLTFSSCDNDDDFDSDTIAEVFELRNVNFSFSAADGYTIFRPLSPRIFDSDVILIYRLSGTIDSNTPIWQQIPRTLFLNQGELDYDFDFSKEDFTIYAGGTYNLSLTPEYINNQTFRIVIVPGFFAKTLKDTDYISVMNALKLNEGKVQNLKF